MEQETSQGEGGGDKSWRSRRQVMEEQETSQGEGGGDKSGRSRRQVREISQGDKSVPYCVYSLP